MTRCDSYFDKKCGKSFIQNASGFLLQNGTVLLKNTTVITKCDIVITNSDSYYKIRHLLQITFFNLIEGVQGNISS